MNYTKHIVLLTPGFAENEADTACTPYLQDFFLGLKKMHPEWRLSIVAIQYPFQAGKYIWNGIEVHALGGKNRKLNRLNTWRKTQKAIAELNKLQKIDVIHSFWLREAAYLGAKAAEKLGTRHIATAMGQDSGPSNKYLKGFAGSKTIFACLTSDAVEELTLTLPNQRFEQFKWGISPPLFQNSSETKRDIDLLAVGSLVEIKRHDRFIRLISSLKDDFPNLKAVLVGEGKLRKEIEAQISDLGLESYVELKGQLPREEVFSLMRRSKILVHTSAAEGMGFVYVEALASGLHLVTTPAGHTIPSEKWQISPHTIGLAKAASHFLHAPIDFEPHFPLPISGTVDTFSKIYFDA